MLNGIRRSLTGIGDFEEGPMLFTDTYAQVTNYPTLSIDEALYIDALPEDQQPGVNVRRYESDRPLTDEELIARFLEKMKHFPAQERTVTWVFALCLSLSHCQSFLEEVAIKEMFVEHPTLPIIPGYPLSSLSYNPALNKMRKDFTDEDIKQLCQPIYQKIHGLLQQACDHGDR